MVTLVRAAQRNFAVMTQTKMRPVHTMAEKISRDFRTDTITIPTDDMFDEMKQASRGDSVYHEDADTAALEKQIAQMSGKAAALFCVSGTLSNQLALRTHLTQPPHSVVLDSRAHIHCYEAGGVAFHSQAVENTVTPENGHHMTMEEVLEHLVEGEDIHGAPTKVVALENSLSGMVFPQDEIVRISDAVKGKGVIMHCDGARMWEVMAKTGKSLEELCRPFDTVSLCMSKGLGAPIGSVLVGPVEFIRKATWFKKLFGGGIRQSGSLAVAAAHALRVNLPQLPRTHMLASRLAQGLADLGVRISLPVETNMVWVDPNPIGISLDTLRTRAGERGITLSLGSRMVCHIQTSSQAVTDLLDLVAELKEEFAKDAENVDAAEQETWMRYAKGDWGDHIPKPSSKRVGTKAYVSR